MPFVTLELRPFIRAPRASEAEMREFTARLSLQECSLVAEIVALDLARRGLWRAQAGGRLYCAVEARIVADFIAHDVDLSEIAAQIEAAKWECPEQFESAPRHRAARERHYNPRKTATMPKTKTPKPAATYTPTPVAPQSGPRAFRAPMFRDDAPRREPKKEESRQNDIKLLSDAALNSYARTLNLREREAVAEMIRNEIVRLGFPRSSRVGGAMWLQARKNVMSGLKQFEVDISEARGEMEAAGCKFEDGCNGVVLKEESNQEEETEAESELE